MIPQASLTSITLVSGKSRGFVSVNTWNHEKVMGIVDEVPASVASAWMQVEWLGCASVGSQGPACHYTQSYQRKPG